MGVPSSLWFNAGGAGRKGTPMSRTVIELSRQVKRRLRRVMHRSTDARLKTRYLIVVHTADGHTRRQIAAMLGCSNSTVDRVRHRFACDGEGGLLDRRGDNGQAKIDEDYILALLEAVANLFPEAVLAKGVGTAADLQRLNGIEGIGMRVVLMPSDRVVSFKQPQAQAKLTPDVQEDGQTATTQPADGTWRPLIHGYGSKGKLSDWALAYRAYGKGEVFACQIPLTGRTDDRTPADFDPVAERLLAFMIEADRLSSPQ